MSPSPEEREERVSEKTDDIGYLRSLPAHSGPYGTTVVEIPKLARDWLCDQAVLGALLRRIVKDPNRHAAHDPMIYVDHGTLWFDGSIGLSVDELAALQRAGLEVDS